MRAILDQNRSVKDVFLVDSGLLISQIDDLFGREGLSDHGILDYVLDLWSQLEVAFPERLQFLHQLHELQNPKRIYAVLQKRSAKLA